MHYYFRISRADVAAADDGELFWALVERTWPAKESEDCPEHLARATPGQRALYATMLFAREVDNGGLKQVLWNMEPWFIELAVKGFLRFGAKNHASAVRAALLAFFGKRPPRDLEKRRAIIASKNRQWLDKVIEPLNERLYNEERLWPYWRRYLKAHESEFFSD